MTNSATSTDRRPADGRAGFQAWHFFLLLSMAGATAAVMVSRETHPAALLMLSAAVICAGLVAIGLTQAIGGFFKRTPIAPLPVHARHQLEREKFLLLRSIKELQFDRAMGKVSEEDFSAISSRLRARALTLMQDLDRAPGVPAPDRPTSDGDPVSTAGDVGRVFRPDPEASAACPKCGTQNDSDARFCKNCGKALTKAQVRS